jgi:hypothetical protein
MFHYVYILQSEVAPERHYIGMTSDLTQRLAAHNLARFRIPQNSNLGPLKPLSLFAIKPRRWHSSII